MKNSIGFYVGGYAQAGENGVLKCAFDGEQISIQAANSELENPSWVLAHPTKPLLYAVEELVPTGRLAVLEDRGDSLKLIASMSTQGAASCHISLTPDGHHLLVSNYMGGSLAVYALNEAGIPCRMTDFVQHHMPSTPQPESNPIRQEAPHVHFALCDGKDVYVNDLGLNQVCVYGWDPAEGKLIARKDALEFPGGSGPRHLSFSPDGKRLYVICELDSTIHVFRREDDGPWRRVQTVSVVPEEIRQTEQFARSTGSALHFADAETLCASNRGYDCLTLFRVDADGLLRDRQIVPSGGQIPRDFLPAGEYLFAANQGSDSVRGFHREGQRCAPANARLDALRPTCLCLDPAASGKGGH